MWPWISVRSRVVVGSLVRRIFESFIERDELVTASFQFRKYLVEHDAVQTIGMKQHDMRDWTTKLHLHHLLVVIHLDIGVNQVRIEKSVREIVIVIFDSTLICTVEEPVHIFGSDRSDNVST